MQKNIAYSYITLIALTIAVAIIASGRFSAMAVLFIVTLSVIKFLTVAFQFMDLKNAHAFWKFLIVLFSAIMGGLFIIFL